MRANSQIGKWIGYRGRSNCKPIDVRQHMTPGINC